MNKTAAHKKIFPLLKSSVDTILSNRIILLPYISILFVQLLVVEILYFSNRFPLVAFFGPVISTIWKENFLHYPLNLFLLPELFQQVQIPLFVFVNSFFVAASIGIISLLNNSKKVYLKNIYQDTLKSYVYLVIAAVLSTSLLLLIFKLLGLVYHRAEIIRSTSGVFYIIKVIVMNGTPYFSLMGSIFVTTLFAFVAPVIMIEKKKIFSALFINFKMVFKYFWTILGVVFIPTFMFIVVLLLRNSLPNDLPIPEIRLWTLVGSIILMAVIDMIVNTAVTTFYLLDKEIK